jgi:hypothetical protein
VGDVTRDGVPDLLVGEADGRVRLYVGASTTPVSTEGQSGGVYTYAFRIPPAEGTNPWQNANHPLDVNNDGFYTPLDALIVANYINANGAGALRWPTGGNSPSAYVDCLGDWTVTPQDALLVINDLNAHGAHAVAAPAGTDCSDTPVCTPAGEAGDLEDILTDIAAQLSAAGPR